jgi:hypothetical protein
MRSKMVAIYGLALIWSLSILGNYLIYGWYGAMWMLIGIGVTMLLVLT